MKYFFAAFLSLVTLTSVNSHSVGEMNSVAWTGQKLIWADFKGQPNPDSYGDAATAIRIKAEPYYKRRKLYYNINAFFIPSKSWFRYQTDALLAHEQLHFDLAELYARKARQKVNDLQSLNETDIETYNNAVQEILNESNEADANYDRETLHGSLPRAQASWKLKTEIELMLLQAYSN